MAADSRRGHGDSQREGGAVAILGHSHALSGAVSGAAAGELLLHLPLPGTLALAGLTAGFATLPDLDTCGSCAARSLGFASEAFAWLISRVSGGHRHATHSLLGVAVFTSAAVVAGLFRHDLAARVVLALWLMLAIAAGLRALRVRGHGADLAGLGAAVVIAWTGWDLRLAALACALGCACHIAGDMLTTAGCPLAWPVPLRHFGMPRPLSFVTGTWRETWCVVPVLFGLLGVLAWHAVTIA